MLNINNQITYTCTSTTVRRTHQVEIRKNAVGALPQLSNLHIWRCYLHNSTLYASSNLPKTKNTDLSEFDDRFRARVCFWDRASEVIEELLQTLAALNGDDDDEWKHEQSHWTYRSSAFTCSAAWIASTMEQLAAKSMIDSCNFRILYCSNRDVQWCRLSLNLHNNFS